MSREIIEVYEECGRIEEIVKSDRYLKFEIYECTEEALENKSKIILDLQSLSWKPLKLERLSTVGMYIKTYYFEKN